jgi:hypothetical protein
MESIKDIINTLADPKILISLSAILLFVSVRYRHIFYTNKAAMILFPGIFLFIAISMLDEVPIVSMLFLIPFFTWFSLREGVRNDKRIEEGKPVIEKGETANKVLTWPDLVYTELIIMVLLTVLLIGWSILIPAPLEEAANPANTPNPSKAPWYFLGLQEMLVYFDPWLAGVVFPGLIVAGLIAIPYIDTNPKGNGYFTFNERKWEIMTFLFGFLILWVLLVILGTFLRGPNWNFFGPYEFWDTHKLEALVNVNLSDYVWVRILGVGLPDNILVREMFGFMAVIGYFLIPPMLLAKTIFKEFYKNLGPARYHLMVFLLLAMASLPIKMVLRWTLNMKYIIGIPEYFLNI